MAKLTVPLANMNLAGCVHINSITGIFLFLLVMVQADATDLTHDYEPESCGLCHVEQFKQWTDSYHANAVSPGLLGQLVLFEKNQIVACFECHVPAEDQQEIYFSDASKPVQGVDCTYCHIRDGSRFGPKDVEITPHGPVKSDPLFKKSEFCKTCHQFGDEGILVNGKALENTFTEWQMSQYSEEGKTCQSCHMPDGSHKFKGIHDREMVRSGLAVNAERTQTGLILTLINKGAGHALPTYITPRIRVLWNGVDGTTETITIIQRKMDWHPDTGWTELFDTRLMPGEIRTKVYKPKKDIAGTIEVWVDPDADYSERVYPAIIAAMKESSVDDKSIRQINEAQIAASQSSYRLLLLRCDAGETRECH